MPHLYRIINQNKENHKAFVEGTALRYSPLQQALFFTFMCSLVYVDGSLPCGRFYYEAVEGFFGNTALRASYQYLYLYLGFLAHAADRAEVALRLPSPPRPSYRGFGIYQSLQKAQAFGELVSHRSRP